MRTFKASGKLVKKKKKEQFIIYLYNFTINEVNTKITYLVGSHPSVSVVV